MLNENDALQILIERLKGIEDEEKKKHPSNASFCFALAGSKIDKQIGSVNYQNAQIDDNFTREYYSSGSDQIKIAD